MSEELSPEEHALLRGRQVQLETLASLNGWYPVVAGADGLWWRYLGEAKFCEPFFHDTLAAIPPADRLSLHTGYDAAASFATPHAPSAFIFHTSRCGSTLLTQLLATLPDCTALSEPPAIDSFLRRYYAGQHGIEAEQRLCNIVAALGQACVTPARHLVIKLDSWHITSLPLFRRTFPDTPLLFLYREPAEVMASHRRHRGRQMVPGLVTAAMPPQDFGQLESGDLEGYSTKMLECILSEAYRQADALRLVNYRQLPHIVWDALLDTLGIDTAPHLLAAMKSRAGFHSKSSEQFSGDPQPMAKDADLPSKTLQACYDSLERVRQEQNRSFKATPFSG